MFGLFKLKKKSKKEKNGQSQDDEKENTSSPTKQKKTEKEPAKTPQPTEIKIQTEQKLDIVNLSQKSPSDLPPTPSVPRHNNNNNNKLVNIQNGTPDGKILTVETNLQSSRDSQPSPLSTATTINIHHQNRAPMLSASDAMHSTSFVRGNALSSTISGSDLHRFLNSGYMNGDPYLQRGVELKTPKSPHFHRPPNFSYSRNRPNYVTPHQRHASANRVSASSSDTPRFSHGMVRNTMTGMIRNRSSSPSHFQQQQQQPDPEHHETIERINQEDGSTTIITTVTKVPVNRDPETEEPIRLAKFPGGHQPGPDEEPIIESLDWPSPPYPAAVPEFRARSRSSSNRRAPSTINSIHGTHLSVNGDDDEDSDEDADYNNDEEVQQVLINNSYVSHEHNRQSTGATSVSSSLARVKASRPNSKLRYQNNLFDNDYDDYMLQYKSNKDWKKILSKNTLNRTLGDSSVNGDSSYGDLNNNTIQNEFAEEDNEGNLDKDDDAAKNELNDSKFSKESEEIKKIKNESGMAAELFGEVEAQQKMLLARKLKVDPWKASRTPNAKAEPSVRTRYESPVNASPSRVYNYNNRSMMTNAISGHTLSPTPMGHSQTTSATFIGDISLVNSPITPTHQIHYNHGHHHQHDGAMSPITPNSTNASSLNRNHYINSSSRIISSSMLPKAGLNHTSNTIVYNTAVPRPGYGLANTNKSITLPNSSRYVGLSTCRSYDFETPPHYYQARDTMNSPNKPIDPEKINAYNIRQQNYAQVMCKSTPNLIGDPKVYSYADLKRSNNTKLPGEVDRERLERHLSPAEFKELFGTSIEHFYELPEWQRVNLKKLAKLF